MNKQQRLAIILQDLETVSACASARQTCELLMDVFHKHEHVYSDPMSLRVLDNMNLIYDQTVYISCYKKHMLCIHQDGAFEIRELEKFFSLNFYQKHHLVIKQYPLVCAKPSITGKSVWDYRKKKNTIS